MGASRVAIPVSRITEYPFGYAVSVVRDWIRLINIGCMLKERTY